MKRRRRRKDPRARRNRNRTRSLLLVIVPAVVVGVAAGIYLVRGWGANATSSTAAALRSASAGAPQAAGLPVLVAPRVYELGRISQAAGMVTVEMTVANTGTADLVVRELETSCGCTRARLVVGARPGPWFGMRGHGPWPQGWSAVLRPGEKGLLVVQYDPSAHGIYRGPVDRVVVIHSNDPREPHAAVRLLGVQVP